MMQKGNVVILIIIVAALAIGAVIYYKSGTSQPESTKSAEQTKTFQSKNLKLSISVSNFEVKDLGISASLSNQKGEIKISRTGTQYPDIKSHLNYFDPLRGVTQIEDKEVNIDTYKALRRIENSPDGRRLAYYIMVESLIYTLSSTSEALFDDLDQIAQSFRYTP